MPSRRWPSSESVTSYDVSIRKGAIWWFATRERRGERETILKAVLNPDLLND